MPSAPSSPTPASASSPGSLAFGPLRLVELSGLEVSGLAIAPLRDGASRISVGRIALRSALAHAGPLSVRIANAALQGVTAHVAPSAAGGAPDLVDCTVERIEVGELQAIARTIARPPASQGASLHLDPLDDLDGFVRAFITDALWFVDAEIVLPVTDGRIDLRRVDVEHIGPNSTLEVGPTGLHVRAPHGGVIDLLVFDSRHVGLEDGVLEVRTIVETLVRQHAGEPVARIADAKLVGPLERTRVSAELCLGEGALGTAAHHVVLTGRDRDRNRVEVSSPALAERVLVRVPQFAARSGSFVLGPHVLRTAAIEAAFEAHVASTDSGQSDARTQSLELVIGGVTIENVGLASYDDGTRRA